MSRRSPHIALLGAGPTGIEAALAACEAGLPFTLYEAGDRIASALHAWRHVRLFSPWDLDVSPRVRKHLGAVGYGVPTGAACPTGGELQAVLARVGDIESVRPHVRLGHRVRAVGREGLLKHQAIGGSQRAERPFRLLVDGPGGERVDRADVVIDTTGTYGHPNATGDGGIPAPGEADLGGDRIVRQIPDVAGDDAAWAGQRILLVGAGHSAQTASVDLARLAIAHPGTEVTWALRRAEPVWETIPDDALPARSALIAAAQDVVQRPPAGFVVRAGVVVDRFEETAEGLRVDLRERHGAVTPVVVDRVISLTGFAPDAALYRQLQVHECYATLGPIKLAAALLGQASADCMAQTGHGIDTLRNPEPGFFVLGSKSYGRNTSFLMRIGWQQVDDVFALLERSAQPARAAPGLSP